MSSPDDIYAAFLCKDCGVDTSTLRGGIREYYMVNIDVWGRAHNLTFKQNVTEDQKCDEIDNHASGMLCIGCLETRLGRLLVPADFIDCAVNSGKFVRQSERLKNRIGHA